jgi:hypothetical protein
LGIYERFSWIVEKSLGTKGAVGGDDIGVSSFFDEQSHGFI